jgi:hypothetical protein
LAGLIHTRLISAIACLGLVLLWLPLAAAEDDSDDLHPSMTDGVSLDVGIFYPDREWDLRVNGTISGDNEDIDFDKNLKVGNPDDIFAAELAWRFHGRWSLTAQYFDSSDVGSAMLEEDVEWGDVVFSSGTGVTAGIDLTLLRLFVGRQLDTSRYHDVGIGGGIHYLDFGAFIEGTIVIDGGTRFTRESVEENAPLPNIGAWYRYSISPRWAFRSRIDLLSASVGDYEGTLLNASLGVNYQVFRHFGFGMAYNYFELDVSIDKSSWNGDVDAVFKGIYICASAYF